MKNKSRRRGERKKKKANITVTSTSLDCFIITLHPTPTAHLSALFFFLSLLPLTRKKTGGIPYGTVRSTDTQRVLRFEKTVLVSGLEREREEGGEKVRENMIEKYDIHQMNNEKKKNVLPSNQTIHLSWHEREAALHSKVHCECRSSHFSPACRWSVRQ